MTSVFIKGNVPSSKNSKINTRGGSFNSQTVQKYLRSFGILSYSSSKKEVKTYKTIPMTFPVEELKELFKDRKYPIIIEFHFIRNSKRRWDFGNITQIILDLFTAFNIIEDDSMDFVVPMPNKIDEKWYSYDKDEPGVIITVL
jgi:hypothetical protein